MANNEPRKPFSWLAEASHPLITLAAASVLVGIEWWDGPLNKYVPTGLVGLVLLTVGLQAGRRDDQTELESQARVREAERGLEEALRTTVVDSVNHEETRPTGDGDDLPHQPSTRLERKSPDEIQVRLTLSELWAVTHRRLDHYHGIALGQAKQSFRNAQIAMGLGFALLCIFVILALNATTATNSVVIGGLGTVSAALSGYVSRTFIRSQEVAAGHLRAYFDQPLEFSRYLAAERLMADAGLSEEKRAEVLSSLVQTMIAGPAGPVPTSATEQQSSTTP
ncbi:TRADD-N-associated membrane domain-containing protein [Streptomyces canus]|uniref:TRADD-N-associated membrane domain-containing protein n=1 Tax=Streptomyces canus TaxID=58343 RepID=UPI002251CD9A|nr:hypothetical protein [Streptomyces canus]MCX4859029.1 hypothetical protein [Streptomyces canus]